MALRRLTFTTGNHAFTLEHCCECDDQTLHKYGRCVHCGTTHTNEVVTVKPHGYMAVQQTANRRRRRGRAIRVSRDAA